MGLVDSSDTAGALRVVDQNAALVVTSATTAGQAKSIDAIRDRLYRREWELYQARSELMGSRALAKVKEDIPVAVQLEFEGKTNAQIAEHFGVTGQTISNWRKNYPKEWRKAYEDLLQEAGYLREAAVARMYRRLSQIGNDLIERHLELADEGSDSIRRSANKDLLDMLTGRGKNVVVNQSVGGPSQEFYQEMQSEREAGGDVVDAEIITD